MMRFMDTVIELFVGLIALFIITKVVGKRQISQITPFDFISAIVLGELLGNGIYDKEIGVIYIVSTLTVWGVLMFFVEVLSQKFLKLRSILEGNPSILIKGGIINRNELKKSKININELQNLLRQKDVFSVREVEYAILESDGKLSVRKKSKYDNPTSKDLDLPYKDIYMPVTFISDGEVLWDNLRESGFDEKWLKEQLHIQQINDAQEVFYAEWKKDEGMYIVLLKDNE